MYVSRLSQTAIRFIVAERYWYYFCNNPLRADRRTIDFMNRNYTIFHGEKETSYKRKDILQEIEEIIRDSVLGENRESCKKEEISWEIEEITRDPVEGIGNFIRRRSDVISLPTQETRLDKVFRLLFSFSLSLFFLLFPAPSPISSHIPIPNWFYRAFPHQINYHGTYNCLSPPSSRISHKIEPAFTAIPLLFPRRAFRPKRLLVNAVFAARTHTNAKQRDGCRRNYLYR